MKKTITNHLIRSISIIAMILSLVLLMDDLSAQNRDGSIDLSASEGRAIYVNHNGSGSGLGVEGTSFSVEAWVYLLDNNNKNFNFFKFRNGDARVSLQYRGDDDKTDGPWKIEVKGTGYGETSWELDYNKNIGSVPDFQDSWHHVAFTYNGSSGVKLYIDGVERFGWTLVSGGSGVSALYPVDGDGDNDCIFGGESVNSDSEGKLYLAEARIWKTQLSSSEISRYYDEEVNSSHPHWTDLIRYYQGHQTAGSGDSRTFEDVSPVSEYDATVSNADVSVSASFTPIIKPGSFDNSVVSTNFTAGTCQESEIEIKWDNFQNDAAYRSYTTPQYEVRRSRDNKEIYSGNASDPQGIWRDTDVSPGDSESYTLKTFWYIDGVAYYSDDVITTNEGNMKEEFSSPSGFTASDENCNGTIELNWDALSPAPPFWTVERSTSSDFSSVTILTSDLDGKVTTYTDQGPNAEQTYYYRIIASGNDDNGCEVKAAYSVGNSGVTSDRPTAPTDFTVSVDQARNEINLAWTNPSNSLADGYIITRQKTNGTGRTEIVINDENTITYSDNGLDICETYEYSVAAYNSCFSNGIYSNTTHTAILGQTLNNYIAGLTASKGYFSNNVRLEWEINGGLSQVDNFEIERAVSGSTTFQSIGSVVDNLVFEDETALPGTFYTYRVYAKSTCNDLTSATNAATDLGFRQPFGIVNGHIAYSGGNAVEGVTVNFESQDGAAVGKSLKFDGDGDYVAIEEFYYEGTDYKEMTVETWFKTSSSAPHIIAASDANEYWRLYINNGLVSLIMENRTAVVSEDTYNDGNWHHVAVVFDNGIMRLYMDGEAVDEESTGSTSFGSGNRRFLFLGVGSKAGGFNGSTGPNDWFDGNLDEFRLWSVARGKDEIKRDYNRLLSNEQSGLEIYYRFDEGTGNQVFDASKNAEIFNKHDGTFVGGVNFSDEIPDAGLLGIKGVTDKFGDYTADYIPYLGSGDVFRVVPAFGQHVFEPGSRSIYLGDGAAVQNDIDFTDISSFTVAGKVTYENSEVPVEGVSIYIDGLPAVDANGHAVRTDNEGNYTVDVPIGRHFLTAIKENHTFSEGYFPALNEYGDIEKHEFTEDLTVNFVDDTKITVAGRVVGGNVQAALPLGFDLSTNNVDVATVEFQLQLENYDLDLTDDAVYNIVSVTTDPYSGEYSIELIPEKWIINQAGNDTYFIDPADISVADLTNSLVPLTSTTEVDNGDGTTDIEEYEYHHDLSFIIQTSPIIEVLDGDGDPLHGADEVEFYNQLTEEQQILTLGDDNPFLHDVYVMNHDYDVNIYVHELYENPNHPDGALVDKVPVKDADVTINDQLMFNPEPTQGTTDENGLFEYVLVAGMPSLDQNGTNTYTKTFEVEASVNGIGITWNQGNVYRAYVLGARALEGTDFITYGPDQVDIVLRDPPGSNSYAYIEQGSSFSSAETWSFNQGTSQGLDFDIYTGLLVQAGGGAVGPVVKNETIYHTEIGLEIDRFIDYEGTYGRRVTFNERIETSSDPEDVGSMADVYIGRSLNAFFQETKNLKVIPKAYADANALTYYGTGEFVLGEINGFTMDEGNTETYFVYSQRHILEELIPSLMNLLGNLMASNKYDSKLPVGHECYGMGNDNLRCLTNYFSEEEIEAEDRSYTYKGPNDEMDSVAFLNDQISGWIRAIAMNESEKVRATTESNLSVDGSAGAYTSTLKEEYSSEYNWNSARELNFYWNGNTANLTNNAGLGISSTMNVDLNFSNGEEHTQEKSVEFGYVIDERDEGDFYSIDVKRQEGIGIFDPDDFVDNIPSKSEFVEDQLLRTGVAGGVTAGIMYFNWRVISVGIGKYVSNSGAGNAFLASLQFGTNLALWSYEMVDVAKNVTKTIDRANGIESIGIGGYAIGSPIFSIRGGQSRCPYEGAEFTNYHVDANKNLIQLHTATLQREAPIITSAPTIVSNVPDNEVATFTLTLANQSESDSDMWYELSIDEATNPDGAVVLIDGLSAERSFFVPASGAVTKTLTIAPGSTGALDFEDIGIVLHSSCQADPALPIEVIADTVFVTAKFLPTCSAVDITNMNENWIVNYEDGGSVPITLGGYDINSPTLESVSFLYKTLSGNPITIRKYFVDDQSDAYLNYSGEKGVLPGGDVSFTWDVSDLVDRQYQIFAKSTCIDGSTTESEYLTGTLDTNTPIVFGTPDPVDGIYDAGDDIRIQFSEELEADLVRDNNIVVQSVLNGADVSHATSVQFDGIDDDMDINSVSFNGKSFTLEFWAQYEEDTSASAEILLQHGSGSDLVQIRRVGKEITFSLGTKEFTFDPDPFFTAITPWDAWHHWTYIYNAEEQSVSIYMDDQIVGNWTGETFNPAFTGKMIVGNGEFKGRIHEFRIWEDVRSFGEVISNMSLTLTGNEPGLYGYWAMDEGTGNLAIDQTAGRNATIAASWSLEPGGVSWEFTGTNYLSLDSRNVAIANETDLTVEFWFKAGAQADSVGLFTNGRGDGGDEITDSESVTSIIADENGLIWVLSGGYAFQGTNQSFFDDEWHHLAFVLDRKTNGKLYIDGSLQNQELASNFAGLSGAEVALGARIWKADDNGGFTNVQDLFLTGYMDEVRVWNTARSSDLVERYMHSKLVGDEVGLVAYTAFETYQDVQGAYLLQYSLEDLTTDEDLTDVNDAVSSDAMDYYADQKPPVRDIRGLQNIPFQYAVNGDEIIITPNVDMNRIEGQVLEISVKNVQDLNGNRQLSPVTWTAYSQQNQVLWNEDQIPLEKHVDDALAFTATFTNASGVTYDYSLENIPAWLSADITSGTVNPLETVAITFEVSEALNIGSYENGINLTTENGFDEKLNVSIRVFGDEPDWSVNEKAYEYSMSVFARLIIEGEISRDEFDQVGAFVGDEIRGVANLEYIEALDTYQAFINIYSNTASGETITWKAYDASTGRIHENVTPPVSFESNGIHGSVVNPEDLEANQEIGMSYELNAGWNWISFNLNDPNLTVVNNLLGSIGTDGDIIKNQSAFDQYSPATGWFGTLTITGGMKHGDMYKLFLTEAAEIQLVGSPVATADHSISLRAGWNHLGYVPQFKMTLQEALVNMTPTDGDLIKTENEFAQYSDALGWVGSLDKMEPGQGYMVYLNNAATLEYPVAASLAASRAVAQPATTGMEVVYSKTGDNMSMIAEVRNLEALNLSDNYLLVAQAGGKTRGYATAEQLNNQTVYFLSISADAEEAVTFAIYDADRDVYHPLQGGTTSYKADNVLGSIQRPFELGVADEGSEALQELLVAPNPFNEQISIYVPTAGDGPVAVKLIDLNGRTIIQKQFEAREGGTQITLSEELNTVRRGLYILSLDYNGQTERIKVTKE